MSPTPESSKSPESAPTAAPKPEGVKKVKVTPDSEINKISSILSDISRVRDGFALAVNRACLRICIYDFFFSRVVHNQALRGWG
jgi:hypothetical protein